MNKKNLFFIIITTAVLLFATTCSGGSVDPGAEEYYLGNGTAGSGGSITSGGGGSGGNNGGGWTPGGSGGGSGGGNLSGTTWKCTDSSTGITLITTLTFTSGSRVRMETSMEVMGFSIPSDTYEGTYTVSGSTISIEWDAGYYGSGTYTRNGNKITTSEGYVFIKQ